MDIEILSKENIKPSSPTPPHLKTFKLSALDHVAGSPFVPIILFYPNHNGNNILQALERSLILKKSLSKTLTQFYPLAGTIKNNLFIDCNDIGAHYALALVRSRLHDFLRRPENEFINWFLPTLPGLEGCAPGDPVTNVQVNIFECGGMAIGLWISHRVVDAAAAITFVKAWTNMASGAKEVVYPNLTASSLFPAKDSWVKEAAIAMCGSWLKQGKCITKRFVFDTDALAALKAEAARNGAQNPTRVEVISAFLWKCLISASKEACGVQKPSRLAHIVNLRRKLALNSSEDSFGNVIWVTTAQCQANDNKSLASLVKKVHASFAKIDVEFVNKAQGENGHIVMLESIKEMGEIVPNDTMDNYLFTSWCKMGFYEIDFGWGKPSWVAGFVCHGSPVFLNLITLVDTKYGEGIEAWVNLEEQEMEILQGNPELLAYASLDPSPLPNDKVAAVRVPLHDMKILVDPIK